MSKTTQKRQLWYCEKCKTIGEVKYGPKDADVSSVIGAIGADHERVCPSCNNNAIGGVFNIRIINESYHGMDVDKFLADLVEQGYMFAW